MAGPLDGITVVALEQAVAAPFATRQLADLGARVIKVERPDTGDFARSYDETVKGLSSYFVWLNRTKESLTLDLKRPAAGEVMSRLLARADVFVENLAPGAACRLGLDATALTGRHPRLIVCSISGYGSSGPYASKKAYDLLVQGEVGLMSLTGTEAHPSKAGISVADIAAGMYACSGILAALLARASSGRGSALEVSLFDALAEWVSAPAYYASYGGAPPRRTGAHHASIAPYGPYETREGGPVCLAIQNAREWTRFCCDVLHRPELEDDGRFRTNGDRVRHRQALDEAIAAVFGRLAASEAVARLDAAGIANARLRSIAEFVEHPQLGSRDRWREIGTPAGPVRALLPPLSMRGAAPVLGAVPALGQHTEAILADLGFDAGVIAAWRREGTI
ncbi:MAG TPA: CaiB/BaiF CoA-transferase family protein [Vicinamibacterales bacterium]|nr:CaiB/BaiF CoA-transferase family protein [Vicinamibacterales bacterium]